MNEYSLKVFCNNTEIEITDLPDDYLYGIIHICKEQLNRNSRFERVVKNMINNMNYNENKGVN